MNGYRLAATQDDFGH